MIPRRSSRYDAFEHELGVAALVDRYATGAVPATCLLTSVYHICPADLLAPSGVANVDATVLAPLDALRKEGKIVLTDFTSVVKVWRTELGGRACLVEP